MPKNLQSFSNSLITWYLKNKRDLPWRNETNPYHIWLSEIMLQQTRVAQGLPYYLKFTERFPTVFDLANASEDEVLKLWQGLGYYSRARNLHTTAKYIANELHGQFPNNFSDLLQLKGVGDYTASAIASICFGEPTAVVDGNVYRVLSRVFGIDIPINSTEGVKHFKALAQELIDPNQPGTYNQAVMEFGARHCTPQNPLCNDCVFSETCEAFNSRKVAELPVKLRKQKVRKRFFNYLVVFSSEGEKTLLRQRTEKGIWQQLFEFPLVETTSEVTLLQLKKARAFQEFAKTMDIERIYTYNDSLIVHKLSHQHLYTRFWIVEANSPATNMTPISEVKKYPVPVLIENFISEYGAFQN